MKKTKLLLASLLTVATLCVPITTYGWNGTKEGTGTHAVITEQAVQMLTHDLNQGEPQKVKDNVAILNQYINDLKIGSTFPDYDPNGYDLYQDHFWDPDTGYNFTHTAPWYTSYTVTETADSQSRKFAALALSEWKKGNFQSGERLLGQAIHYLGDINCPYHAANITAVDSPGHVKYETYADENRDKYLVSTMNETTMNSIYSNSITTDDFSNWITKNNTYWGKISKGLYFTKSTMSNSWADWDYSLGQALPNAQKSIALFLYRFINEASNTMPVASLNFNQLQVVIKTADLLNAGTDDYVYFGFETNDGQKFEWKLDNAGNDLERNQTDNYNFTLPKTVDAATITNTWLRKDNFTVSGDDWKPQYIKVIIGGDVRQDTNISSWLSGSTTYTVPFSLK
ncbi:zinc dependent phospholipase C family protein [Clostridium tagluense]|uniref:phospholipase C n=1 Tax=Clostridium tagluense TaxID=360422 RepID=UPI001C0BEEF1|nr:phospholipase C [Clostridium tagluense]MBU3128003.1 zinc dependent phospholipase C family protein [Clostridium tagluense]MCB2311413.1 zinc dependent phospholipase C family protein [Clostridium tagluense]MCB2316137.1 zinc dependent phospholipase C family protein [Clostridium tagluense]MCB2321060.1 zinc dependent phospholipase C family protein [Clostridium tagluense]MCB2326076.1 zinc dependent phospholipase C family protein [Clostridium tagluense]